MSQPERPEKAEKAEKAEHPEQSVQPSQPDQPDQPDQPERLRNQPPWDLYVRMYLCGAIVLAVLFHPIYVQLQVLGIFRSPSRTALAAPEQDVRFIPSTPFCEDIHYYPRANQVFTACDSDAETTRFQWFPPGGTFIDPTKAAMGTLKVVDLKTFKAKTLTLQDFDVPSFTTHGIDVIPDPKDKSGKTVLIFAINHLPNPDYVAYYTNGTSIPSDVPQAKSQIEIFRHVIGSSAAKHVRSVQHDDISTPNDIWAESADSFYVTNDHYYRSGHLRYVEDAIPWAKLTYVYHVQVVDESTLTGKKKAGAVAPQDGLLVRRATPAMHNLNGMGHVQNARGEEKSPREVLITSAASGQLYRANITMELPWTVESKDRNLTDIQDHRFDITLDNPSYYADPWADRDSDVSGYVTAGLTQAAKFARDFRVEKKDGPQGGGFRVYLSKLRPADSKRTREYYREHLEWKTLFEDDGSLMRAVTTALVVPVDPKTEGGAKKGWLFLASVLDEKIVAVKVGLDW